VNWGQSRHGTKKRKTGISNQKREKKNNLHESSLLKRQKEDTQLPGLKEKDQKRSQAVGGKEDKARTGRGGERTLKRKGTLRRTANKSKKMKIIMKGHHRLPKYSHRGKGKGEQNK